jgi:hypothetical protein
LEEDDSFLSISSEIWEYDLADGKEEEFTNALHACGKVLEFDVLESADELGVT